MKATAIVCILAVWTTVQAVAWADVKGRTFPYADGETLLKGYLAYDDEAEGKRPGVLVIHEWWGLNDYAKTRTRQLAQLGWPDMTMPIAYALNYPRRRMRSIRRLDLAEAAALTFEAVDRRRFPSVDLAWQVLQRGRGAGAVLNGANEAAVEAFEAQQITFNQITELTEQCLREHNWIEKPNLRQLLEADKWARDQVRQNLPESEQIHNKIPN